MPLRPDTVASGCPRSALADDTQGTADRMTRPEVSVIVPCLRVDRHLETALQSVLDAQDVDLEVILVLDGEREEALPRRFREDPRVVIAGLATRSGAAVALNRGLDLARAPLIARLDADDVSLPGRLRRQVEFLAEHPDVHLVGGLAYLVDQDGVRLKLLHPGRLHEDLRRELLRRNWVVHSSVMARRQSLLDIAGYNVECRRQQDYELWLRLALDHGLALLHEPLVEYRYHPGMSSRRAPSLGVAGAVAKARRELGRALGVPTVLTPCYTLRWVAAELTMHAGLRRPGYLRGVGRRARRGKRPSRTRNGVSGVSPAGVDALQATEPGARGGR